MRILTFPLPRLLVLGSGLALVVACHSDSYRALSEDPELLHRGMRRITDIMRHDIFSPPVASRIYAYSAVAAYEALRPGYEGYRSLAGQVNGLTEVPKPEAGKVYCFPLASIVALTKVGRHLVFSEEQIDALRDTMLADFAHMGIPHDVYDRSVAFGEAVADCIITWSKGDRYAQTRSMPKFTINAKDPARWVPTPPQYADAVEPHWSQIRPWVLDSARQFKPAPPLPYSEDKKSAFYQAALEVYEIGKKLSAFERETALYWDCNPFEMTVTGHLMVALKKISPTGHWINITTQACRQANASLIQSAEAYVLVALAIADAFISCWTEKYTSALLRPETYINRHIDPDWRPFIETPPFPEHTSGHSTISAAAATVLTRLFGENFSFTDSTEVEFGMKPRSFASFYEASDQAAMSRLYGGIHYRHGNESGRQNGRQIGQYVWEKIRLRSSTKSSSDHSQKN
ncbi:MAG: vanadium-dependent haloperoxidase [Saprospiraceae bacterium]|nr:vanadium-dependent haloperoxidase [Saprospiraceae bacterium]MDW8483127.1 vanadium-dependent haloperoxidase [Saprospiraceae bacterium]